MSKTVFVLGAGASMPFGFPSGEGLINEIFKELKCNSKSNGKTDPRPDQELLRLILQEFDDLFIENFLDSLRKSQTNSIDNFLSHNSQYRELGKICIFYIILKYEKASYSIEKLWNGDWYKYIWNYMDQQNFHPDLTVYTFNYDRSFEYYFFTTIKNLNNYSHEETFKIFKKLDINHFHGTVGSIFSASDNYISYGDIQCIKDCNDLSELSKRIEVIYEVENGKKVFSEFQNACSDASDIIFLGFGFSPENIERLGFVNENEIKLKPNVLLGGTGFSLTPMEIEVKTKYLKPDSTRIQSFKPCNCLEYLRSHFDCTKLRKLNP